MRPFCLVTRRESYAIAQVFWYSERRYTMPEQPELPQQKGKRVITEINSRKGQNIMICKRLTSNERPTFPKRAIITAGMPYGNKNLHFGHVGGMFIHADIFARFLRDRIGKDNVIFLSGTDCYGSPVMESYRRLQETGYEGTLEDYVRVNHENQKKLWKAMVSVWISLEHRLWEKQVRYTGRSQRKCFILYTKTGI